MWGAGGRVRRWRREGEACMGEGKRGVGCGSIGGSGGGGGRRRRRPRGVVSGKRKRRVRKGKVENRVAREGARPRHWSNYMKEGNE